jgi:hypothetical protein
MDTDHLSWVIHTRKQTAQYLMMRSNIMKNHALVVHALDGIIPHGGAADKKSAEVHSHPLGKPRSTTLSKYLDVKINEFVAKVLDTSTATSLHERCLLCDKFRNKAGKNGKLKTSVFKLLARLHSDCTKKCLSHLKMKMSEPSEQPKVKKIAKVSPVDSVTINKNIELTDDFRKRNAKRINFGVSPLPWNYCKEAEPSEKRIRISGVSIPDWRQPDAQSSTSPSWTKVVTKKRSAKQRRKMKLDLISELEHKCEVLDSQIQKAKRAASDPNTGEVRNLDVLPGLKKSKREIVEKLLTLRPKVSRKQN